jgi:hypothetical protein
MNDFCVKTGDWVRVIREDWSCGAVGRVTKVDTAWFQVDAELDGKRYLLRCFSSHLKVLPFPPCKVGRELYAEPK